MLVAYAAFWAFANLAPFDITLNVDRLANRWREGEIVLIPFGSNLPLARLWWDAVVTAVSAVPWERFCWWVGNAAISVEAWRL